MTLGKGKILFDNDFTGIYDGTTIATAGTYLGGGVSLIGVNEGSIASTVDETGGILAVTNDTADNDNHCLIAGKFSPSDGALTLETRFKLGNNTVGVFVGFTETMALDTPVVPAEFATATMTYNGTGGMVGFNYDDDGTTDDWRAVMGDGGVAICGSGNGIRVNATNTVDRFYEVKIDLWPSGEADLWFGHTGDVNANGEPILRLVKQFKKSGGTVLTPTDLFFPVLIVENRDGNARTWEVDYFRGWAGRDWRTN